MADKCDDSNHPYFQPEMLKNAAQCFQYPQTHTAHNLLCMFTLDLPTVPGKMPL